MIYLYTFDVESSRASLPIEKKNSVVTSFELYHIAEKYDVKILANHLHMSLLKVAEDLKSFLPRGKQSEVALSSSPNVTIKGHFSNNYGDPWAPSPARGGSSSRAMRVTPGVIPMGTPATPGPTPPALAKVEPSAQKVIVFLGSAYSSPLSQLRDVQVKAVLSLLQQKEDLALLMLDPDMNKVAIKHPEMINDLVLHLINFGQAPQSHRQTQAVQKFTSHILTRALLAENPTLGIQFILDLLPKPTVEQPTL